MKMITITWGFPMKYAQCFTQFGPTKTEKKYGTFPQHGWSRKRKGAWDY